LQVGVVNFNPSCRTSEQDTANVFSDIVYVSCPENVFSSGRQDSTEVSYSLASYQGPPQSLAWSIATTFNMVLFFSTVLS